MNKQQTAVQWLIEYMEANFHLTDESREKFKEAKEMEKMQMKDFFGMGYRVSDFDTNAYRNDSPFSEITAESYYEEKYGNDNKK